MLINGKELSIVPDANLRGANLRGADLRGADLRGADLSRTNLSRADLSRANLSRANLSRANLGGADLRGANLGEANLGEANLYRANLGEANLYRANLGEADLRGANLYRANLSAANLRGANLNEADDIPALVQAQTSILPAGELIGWKKLRAGAVCKLSIPADARRSNATGRKCRASYAIVLEGGGSSLYDPHFLYEPGQRVEPRGPFDENRWEECASGIHFFITREEAEAYEE